MLKQLYELHYETTCFCIFEKERYRSDEDNIQIICTTSDLDKTPAKFKEDTAKIVVVGNKQCTLCL